MGIDHLVLARSYEDHDNRFVKESLTTQQRERGRGAMRKLRLRLVISGVAGIMLVVGCGKQESVKHGAVSSLKSVKVAVIMPLTGPQAAIGRGTVNSIRLAFKLGEQRLAAKGIKTELEILDDASKPETAVAQAQRVTSDPEVVLALVHFNSPCALATVDIYHEAGMPAIIPAAVNSRITEGAYREIVRTCNTDVGQAQYMAKFLFDIVKPQKIFALHDSSSFGKGLVDALEEQLAIRGVKFIGTDAFHVGDVDFSSVLVRIQDHAPDIIVLGGLAAEGSLLRKQIVEKNIGIPMIGFSGIFYDTFIKNAGAAADGTAAIFPLPPLDESPGGREFLAAYQAEGFKEPYESAGPFGYVAGQVAVQALEAGAITRAAIVEKLKSGWFDTAFGQLGFDERGEMNLKMFCFYTVKNGRWTVTHRVDALGNIISVTQ
jgi:branched-chain amino acid transport system substrate-binding protein